LFYAKFMVDFIPQQRGGGKKNANKKEKSWYEKKRQATAEFI